jgi:hypothetical protein
MSGEIYLLIIGCLTLIIMALAWKDESDRPRVIVMQRARIGIMDKQIAEMDELIKFVAGLKNG